MPVNGPQTCSGSLFFRDRTITHPAPGSGRKTRLCERFNSSDCQNKADLGLVKNGARIGLRLDPEKGNPGSIWARISVARIGWIRGAWLVLRRGGLNFSRNFH